MNEIMVDYLNSLDISKIMRDRIEKLYAEAKRVCPEELNDMFLEESDDSDPKSKREFVTACFFSENYVCEFHNFLHDSDFFIINLKNKLVVLQIKKMGYDGDNLTIDSKLRVIFQIRNFDQGVYFATGSNTRKLEAIFTKFLVKHLEN